MKKEPTKVDKESIEKVLKELMFQDGRRLTGKQIRRIRIKTLQKLLHTK